MTSKAVVAYGGSATLSAVLRTASGAVVPSQTVNVFWSTNGGASYSFKKSVSTDSNGRCSYDTGPSAAKILYRFYFPGSATLAKSYSNVITQQVFAVLTGPNVPASVTAKTYFKVSGYLKPKHAAGSKPVQLFFERAEGGKWVRHLTVLAPVYDKDTYTSVYAASVALPETGSWRVRGLHYDAGHYPTYTAYQYVNALRPRPTIYLSLDKSTVTYDTRYVRAGVRAVYGGRAIPSLLVHIYRNGSLLADVRTNSEGYASYVFPVWIDGASVYAASAGTSEWYPSQSAVRGVSARPAFSFAQSGNMFEYPALWKGHTYQVLFSGTSLDLYSPSGATSFHKYGSFTFTCSETGTWEMYSENRDWEGTCWVKIW